MTEKFCLRWNDFEANISTALQELKDDKDFFDVTVACEDQQIQAHKVILSACSPFFRSVLKRNPHQHPLVYLKGVNYRDLVSIVNFMYHGEVNIAQEELNTFLATAEELEVKGLTQHTAPRPGPARERTDPPRPSKRPRPAPPPARQQEVQEVKELLQPVKAEPMAQGSEAAYLEQEQGGAVVAAGGYAEGYEGDYGEEYDQGGHGYGDVTGLDNAAENKGDIQFCPFKWHHTA
jgi:hypothetical protein